MIPVLLTIVLLVAVVTDIRTRKIYNWLTFPAIVLGIALNVWFLGWHGLVFSLEGVGVACLSLLLFALLGGMGAGDVKLLWAVGAMMGPGFTIWALLFTTLAGGVIGIIFAARRGVLTYTIKNALTGGHVLAAVQSPDSLKGMASASKAGKIAYAPAIALGVAAAAFLIQHGVVVKPF